MGRPTSSSIRSSALRVARSCFRVMGTPPTPSGVPSSRPSKWALAQRADDHDVVGAVPGGHAHSADVVLEAPGGDSAGDHAIRLGVNAAEGRRGGQALAGRQRRRGTAGS